MSSGSSLGLQIPRTDCEVGRARGSRSEPQSVWFGQLRARPWAGRPRKCCQVIFIRISPRINPFPLCRYHNLFIEVAQSMIEEYLGDRQVQIFLFDRLRTWEFQPPVRDALDAFIFQRVYMDRTTREANAGNTAATEDVRKKYPPQLLRRLWDILSFDARNVDLFFQFW